MGTQEVKKKSGLGFMLAVTFLLFVVTPIVAVGIGLLFSHLIPGCAVGEDGASQCIVHGISLNWPVFWLVIGGFWSIIFGIPLFIVTSLLLVFVGAMEERNEV